ncbi:putative bifunctional diguanylate cyclase/phosphodiesterase [Chitinasiproducens palmae]|uniref:EAL domain, c-di-GMP-specific phosphodiesterase class I (Or its enzymatically inactive variant) n=1 Tax=Chitinasiproducens palmae TaxID=1770053 RepID=A0A1H2PQM4_9BURK|nr:sensor domain-containing phosphodiesterase [Chitinasiproducens palmae]SDV49054.1 EAL domain, c-di-GMP-specific phosphodiesterase class I (or its enzymatically inactive variant) [Chitinasiproducens palmae]
MNRQSTMIDAAAHERERLDALHALRLLDTHASEEFDRLTRLTAFCFQMPTALISLVDADRQQFISRCGFDVSETPRAHSVCSHAIQSPGVLIVEDLLADPRFATNPLVTAPNGLRFYAGAPLITDSGHAIGSLCVIDYVPRTMTREQAEQLSALARLVMSQIALRQSVGRRDALSGLPNRQQFMADLEVLPRFYAGERRTLVLLDALRIDSVYDMARALGMDPVDSLIRQTGLRLRRLLGEDAPLYHVGVARFAFLTTLPDPHTRSALLERIGTELGQPVNAAGIPIRPAVHAGLVEVSMEVDAMTDALRQAMNALSEAIEADRPWVAYDADTDAVFRRSYSLASGVQRALASDEFHLLYQPRVDLETGRIVSVEALLRWKHPLLGNVSPAEFIPIIERTALMPSVSQWVFEQGMRQLAEWRDLCPSLRMSFNLSPRDFEGGDLPQVLADARARHGLRAADVELEVTEGEWIIRNPSVVAQLATLRTAGCDVAIDDFGSGYSNFAYLKEIPANVIKLDRSLVHDVRANPRSRTIAESIVELARKLGYRTVAEGIEDTEVLRDLRDWQCDEVQGYCIARPLPPEAITELVLRFQC